MRQYLVLDIGGTFIKYALMGEDGSFLESGKLPSPMDSLDSLLAAVASVGEKFRGRYEKAAVSMPGRIDTRTGMAHTGGAFPFIRETPAGQLFAGRLGCPVTVANDANCMILGEAWVGAARGCADVLGVTIGTGLGGGVLTGGRLLEGARGLGGELGHMRTHALDGVPCTCGAAGCWERYASTSALVRRTVQTDPALDSGRAIFAAARQGDKAVLALLEGWIAEIAEGLAGLVHLFNPQLILIGGGVSSQQELLIDPLARQVKARVMPAFAEGLELRPAALANDAGLVGAVRYFLDRRA